MTKNYCDCCAEEIDRKYQFIFLVHIEGDGNYYVDRFFNPVSGVEKTKDLCLPCYNKIYGEAYKKFKELIEVKL